MLDELLEEKQITLNEIETAEEGKNIWVDSEEPFELHLAELYETELANDLKLLEEVKARVAAKTDEIKKFIEDNSLGSFKTELLNAKYVSATTQTSIDSAMLKAKYPQIAAECSKTVPKSSSLSIKLK